MIIDGCRPRIAHSFPGLWITPPPPRVAQRVSRFVWNLIPMRRVVKSRYMDVRAQRSVRVCCCCTSVPPLATTIGLCSALVTCVSRCWGVLGEARLVFRRCARCYANYAVFLVQGCWAVCLLEDMCEEAKDVDVSWSIWYCFMRFWLFLYGRKNSFNYNYNNILYMLKRSRRNLFSEISGKYIRW